MNNAQIATWAGILMPAFAAYIAAQEKHLNQQECVTAFLGVLLPSVWHRFSPPPAEGKPVQTANPSPAPTAGQKANL